MKGFHYGSYSKGFTIKDGIWGWSHMMTRVSYSMSVKLCCVPDVFLKSFYKHVDPGKEKLSLSCILCWVDNIEMGARGFGQSEAAAIGPLQSNNIW